jgi:HPt (histidine-containing phosphotransfer) domain-containing protein
MLLDTAIIDEMRETLGDEIYRGFVHRMLAEVAETTRSLENQLAAGDLEALARAAHRTAGSAAGIGAKALHALLKDIENAARDPSSAKILPRLVADIPARAEETRKALQALVP